MSDHHESESQHPRGGCEQGYGSHGIRPHEDRLYGDPRRGFPQSGAVWTWLAIAFFGLVTVMIFLPRLTLQRSVSAADARLRKLGIVLQEIAEPEPVVPQEALARDREGVFVFVQDYERENHFIRAEVTVEPAGEGSKRILQGLFHGDRIVVSGVGRLRLEQAVKPSTLSTNCLEPEAETNRHPIQEAK